MDVDKRLVAKELGRRAIISKPPAEGGRPTRSSGTSAHLGRLGALLLVAAKFGLGIFLAKTLSETVEHSFLPLCAFAGEISA